MNVRSGFVLLAVVFTARATELKQQTVQAWQEYVQSATARMQDRLHPESHFLKIEEDANWIRKVRNGEVLFTPGRSQGLKRVPLGLIHDWLGAEFVPHTTLNEVLAVVRDYNRYQEFYRPTVVASRALVKSRLEDRFSMVLMNKSLFLTTALDSDYHCSYVRVSDRQWYSVSEATRIQEIENYGEAGQHPLSEKEGNGFLWRLFSITRFEERDGGVYIEIEAIALSRDIPVSVRWIVDPIVRRISRNSLTTSLRQTEDVLRACMIRAGCNTP